jgi:hypothetical protein
LEALAENHFEDKEWKEIFLVENSGTDLELVTRECLGEVGQQDPLVLELVNFSDAKPSEVSVEKNILSAGPACSKFDIIMKRSELSLIVMKLVVCQPCSWGSGLVPFVFCPLVSTGQMHHSVTSKFCTGDDACCLCTSRTSNEILSLW